MGHGKSSPSLDLTWLRVAGLTVTAPRSLCSSKEGQSPGAGCLLPAGNAENTLAFHVHITPRKTKATLSAGFVHKGSGASSGCSDPDFKASCLMITSKHLKCSFQRTLSAILTILTKIHVIIPLLQIRKIGMVATRFLL